MYVLLCRGSYDGYFNRERTTLSCDPWDSQLSEKDAISIYFAFDVEKF